MSFNDLRQVLFLSYEENMILDEEFLLLFDEYSSKNPELEPLVSTWKLAFWSPWPQLKNVLTCAVAVTLQKYFRLASVVQERLVLNFPNVFISRAMADPGWWLPPIFFFILFLYFKLISYYYFNGFCFHILLTFTFFLISIFTCYYSIKLYAILYSNCNVFA